MMCPYVARCPVRLHRIAVIAALEQQGIAPEPADFLFMRGPIRDMGRKDRPSVGCTRTRL
jgi:hypothetical protein